MIAGVRFVLAIKLSPCTLTVIHLRWCSIQSKNLTSPYFGVAVLQLWSVLQFDLGWAGLLPICLCFIGRTEVKDAGSAVEGGLWTNRRAQRGR